MMPKTGEYRKCKYCGKEFYITRSRILKGEGLFCSIQCAGKYQRRGVYKKCKQCGKEFYICLGHHNRGSGKYCSTRCRDLNCFFIKHPLKREKHPLWIECNVSCEVCGKVFHVKPSHRQFTKFCSRKCMSENYRTKFVSKNNPNWKGGSVIKICPICHKEFYVMRAVKNIRKYCSGDCLGKAHRLLRSGKNSILWRGGRSITHKRVNTPEWKILRSRILLRDKFICTACGLSHRKLNVHHIVPYRSGGKDTEDNLRVLCPRCHRIAETEAQDWLEKETEAYLNSEPPAQCGNGKGTT